MPEIAVFVLEKVVPMEIKYVRRKTGLPLASEIFHFTNEVGQRVWADGGVKVFLL